MARKNKFTIMNLIKTLNKSNCDIILQFFK